MGKYVEERKVVGGRVVAIEDVSPTKPIIVGGTITGAIVREDVSIEEGRETIFEGEKVTVEREVVGSFVDGC